MIVANIRLLNTLLNIGTIKSKWKKKEGDFLHKSDDKNNFRNGKYLSEMEKNFHYMFNAYHRYLAYRGKVMNELTLTNAQKYRLYKIDEKFKKNILKSYNRIMKEDFKMLYKEEIYDSLQLINRKLSENGLYLHLKIVGGAALIFNEIYSIETNDVDTITRLEDEVRIICEESSLDINDDALDYIQNYEGCEFIHDEGRSFSNITIDYLTVGSTVKTKLKNCQDDDKAEKLLYFLEDILEIECTVEGISEYLKSEGETPDEHDIEEFLKNVGYI